MPETGQSGPRPPQQGPACRATARSAKGAPLLIPWLSICTSRGVSTLSRVLPLPMPGQTKLTVTTCPSLDRISLVQGCGALNGWASSTGSPRQPPPSAAPFGARSSHRPRSTWASGPGCWVAPGQAASRRVAETAIERRISHPNPNHPGEQIGSNYGSAMRVMISRREVVAPDRKDARAEFAIDADHALVVDHLGLLLGREAADDAAHIVHRAAAAPGERHGREQADLVLLVEEPPEQG